MTDPSRQPDPSSAEVNPSPQTIAGQPDKDSTPRESARAWAVRALTEQAERFPEMVPPDEAMDGLTPADKALALAIYRTTIQRWLTLEHLTERFLSKKMRRLEPGMQAVLLSAGAQLFFMDRLPGYAVVDQAVSLSRKFVRPQAAGMVNAVLRKLGKLTEHTGSDTSWKPATNRIPFEPLANQEADGPTEFSSIALAETCLPAPYEPEKHLPIATSVPRALAKRWCETYGEAETQRLCLHTITNPPTVVAVEPGFDFATRTDDWVAHQHAHAVVWRGKREGLVAFLAMHDARRVQDAASIASCNATADLSPKTILDYCAGRGTKTRQLALMHPNSAIYATDTHPGRRMQLREATKGLSNVSVIDPDDVQGRPYDLIVLDVPCTNTGVLARRPEARYRYSQQTVGNLVQLQRQIVDLAAAWVTPGGGHLLYCTCSIEKSENAKQADRIVRKLGGELVSSDMILPAGVGDSYTDGSYHALLKMPPPPEVS